MGMMAHMLGFEHTWIRFHSVHGIDQIARRKSLNIWGILEAKGGTSGLASGSRAASYGAEMSHQWITYSLEQAVERSTETSASDLRRSLIANDAMLATVFKLNVNAKKFDLRIGAQAYIPIVLQASSAGQGSIEMLSRLAIAGLSTSVDPEALLQKTRTSYIGPGKYPVSCNHIAARSFDLHDLLNRLALAHWQILVIENCDSDVHEGISIANDLFFGDWPKSVASDRSTSSPQVRSDFRWL